MGRQGKPKPERPPRVCAWCGSRYSYRSKIHCSDECERTARGIHAGRFPVRECPRCNRMDLRIVSPDWSICQTCGWQPGADDREIVELTPTGTSVNRLKQALIEEKGLSFSRRDV